MNGYFDHNATTPLSEAARAAWIEAQDRWWHNPSSLYREAAAAKEQLERHREDLADRFGVEPERVVFTSGATEANNAVFLSVARLFPGRAVLISDREHPSVREPARRFCQAQEIAPGRLGDAAREAVPALVSWIAANNETGALAEPAAVRSVLPEETLLHMDATQWVGKLPLQALCGPVDIVTGSAHKFGGPKGVGFAVISEKAGRFTSLIGGPQEDRRRAGTENLAGIAAMLAAWDEADACPAGNGMLRDDFEAALGWPVIGAGSPRLWNTAMVVAPRHDNRLWVGRLSQRGFQISTGSACSAGSAGVSHVLAALGVSPEESRRVLRFSSGKTTSAGDWAALAAALEDVLSQLDARPAMERRQEAGAGGFLRLDPAAPRP